MGAAARRLELCHCSSGGLVLLVVVLLTAQCFVIIMDRHYSGEFPGSGLTFCGTPTTTPTAVARSKASSTTTASSRLRSAASGAFLLQNFSAAVESPPSPPSSSSLKPAPEPAVPLPVVFEGVRARAFDKKRSTKNSNNKPGMVPWCVPAESDWPLRQKDPARYGYLFVKPYKTGSSTASGVNLRLARNAAYRQYYNRTNVSSSSSSSSSVPNMMCLARSDHVQASQAFARRETSKSFLWTILREPSRRLVSQFFHFQVSRRKIEPTDVNFASYVQEGPSDMLHDYYYRSLSLRPYPATEATTVDPGGPDNRTMMDLANHILREYDFIGITERMDESIVVLSFLLNVPLGDVLYLTAKGHGGFDDGGGRGGIRVCTYIWPSFVTPGMQNILEAEQWQRMSHWDQILYQSANRSLDLTIDKLGRNKVAQAVTRFQHALEVARNKCLSHTVFPCSAGGDYTPDSHTDCLWKDSGCGSPCLDQVAHELGL